MQPFTLINVRCGTSILIYDKNGNGCRAIGGERERGKQKGRDKKGKREEGQWWRKGGRTGQGRQNREPRKAGRTALSILECRSTASTPCGWTGSTLDLRLTVSLPAWVGFLMPAPGHPFAESVQVLTFSAVQAGQFCWAVLLHHGNPEQSLCLFILGAAIQETCPLTFGFILLFCQSYIHVLFVQ